MQEYNTPLFYEMQFSQKLSSIRAAVLTMLTRRRRWRWGMIQWNGGGKSWMYVQKEWMLFEDEGGFVKKIKCGLCIKHEGKLKYNNNFNAVWSTEGISGTSLKKDTVKKHSLSDAHRRAVNIERKPVSFPTSWYSFIILLEIWPGWEVLTHHNPFRNDIWIQLWVEMYNSHREINCEYIKTRNNTKSGVNLRRSDNENRRILHPCHDVLHHISAMVTLLNANISLWTHILSAFQPFFMITVTRILIFKTDNGTYGRLNV